jgi:hypothetical protein
MSQVSGMRLISVEAGAQAEDHAGENGGGAEEAEQGDGAGAGQRDQLDPGRHPGRAQRLPSPGGLPLQ